METTPPTRAPDAVHHDGRAPAFPFEDVLPADVVTAIDGDFMPAKGDPIGRLLSKLVHLWASDSGRLIHEEGLLGKVGKKHLAKEIGYRQRIRHCIPPTEARQVMGDDEHAIDAVIADLANEQRETFVVPSARNRGLVGSPAYPGGSPPNPYVWVPIIAQHSGKKGVVWEMGPCWVSSTAEVSERLGRNVLVVQPPAADGHLRLRIDPIRPATTKHSGRTVFEETAKGGPVARRPSLDDPHPDLVLVPLPVPLDAWSITDCIRAWKLGPKGNGEWQHAGLEMWAAPSEGIEVEHPEFSCDLASYMKAVVSRLRSLQQVVAAGCSARVAVTTPMVRGLPRAVEKTIKRSFPRWKLVERRYAFEKDGKVHVGNGTPLVGEAITIWVGGR